MIVIAWLGKSQLQIEVSQFNRYSSLTCMKQTEAVTEQEVE